MYKKFCLLLVPLSILALSGCGAGAPKPKVALMTKYEQIRADLEAGKLTIQPYSGQ